MNISEYKGNEQILISVGKIDYYVVPCAACGGKKVKIGNIESDMEGIKIGGKKIEDGIDAICGICGAVVSVLQRDGNG